MSKNSELASNTEAKGMERESGLNLGELHQSKSLQGIQNF